MYQWGSESAHALSLSLSLSIGKSEAHTRPLFQQKKLTKYSMPTPLLLSVLEYLPLSDKKQINFC